jgi:cephalosporin hydroxylase
MGVRTQKFPCDAWVYQEIIYEYQPDTIIELGNKWGGSTLLLANLLDNIGKGRVIAVDLDHSIIDKKVIDHPRITLIEGDAIGVFSEISSMVKNDEKS